MAGCNSRSHTDPLFNKFNILKFEDLLDYNKKVFMHKFVNEKQPPSFGSVFKRTNNFDSNSNRRSLSYSIDKLKNKLMERLPSATLPRAWNPLDTKYKFLESHSVFKKTIYVRPKNAALRVEKISNYNSTKRAFRQVKPRFGKLTELTKLW